MVAPPEKSAFAEESVAMRVAAAVVGGLFLAGVFNKSSGGGGGNKNPPPMPTSQVTVGVGGP